MSAPAGRSVETFVKEAGISRATLYALIPECAPRFTKIGGKRLIIESPADWLERIAAAGGAKTRRQEEKPQRVRKKLKAARRRSAGGGDDD